jgi:hypothetical protein
MAKKNKPTACNCRKCDRPPVIVKIRAGSWRVACPYLDCIQVSSFGSTEDEAIENWNKNEVVKE